MNTHPAPRPPAPPWFTPAKRFDWIKESAIKVAKWEIHKRLTVLSALWWKFIPGTEVTVKWPVGPLTVEPDHPSWDWALGAHRQEIYSADPNDHYRQWIEKNIGRQGWDWNWKIGRIDNDNGDSLVIKVRQKHAKYVTIMAMMWN